MKNLYKDLESEIVKINELRSINMQVRTPVVMTPLTQVRPTPPNELAEIGRVETIPSVGNQPTNKPTQGSQSQQISMLSEEYSFLQNAKGVQVLYSADNDVDGSNLRLDHFDKVQNAITDGFAKLEALETFTWLESNELSEILKAILDQSYYDIEIHNDYKRLVKFIHDGFGGENFTQGQQMALLGNTKVFLRLISFLFTACERCLFSVDTTKDHIEEVVF